MRSRLFTLLGCWTVVAVAAVTAFATVNSATVTTAVAGAAKAGAGVSDIDDVPTGDSSSDVDVEEGAIARLRCRFDPVLGRASAANVFFWSQNSHSGWDNVAIGNVTFRSNYRVDFVPAEGRYDLEIVGATYERDNGRFACQVRRGGGGTGSELHAHRLHLTVLKPPQQPVISHPPMPFTEDSPVQLACSSVGGSPPPTVLWYRIDGATRQLVEAEVQVAGDRQQPTVATLSLSPSRQLHGATLLCAVWNRAMGHTNNNNSSSSISTDKITIEGATRENTVNQLTASVQLDINYLPRVQLVPSDYVRVQEGQSVTVRCRVDARPSVSTVDWIRQGGYIVSTTPPAPVAVGTDGGGDGGSGGGQEVVSELVVAAARLSDAGVYTCSGRNAVGERRGDLQLDVLHAPRVTVEPRHSDVAAGASVQVTCHVTANPPVSAVYWLRVDGGGAGAGGGGGGVFRQMGATLRLDAVTADDHGEYVCVAENTVPHQLDHHQYQQQEEEEEGSSGGDGRLLRGSASVSVRVRHRPGAARVQPAARSSPAVLGRPLTLTCSAHPPGHPAPSYRWWRRRPASTDPNSADTIEEPITAANWSVARVREEHAGDYWCQAENGLGAGARSAPLTVVVYRTPQLDIHLTSRVSRQAGGATVGFQLSCSAGARPPPTVVWLKNGLLIQPSHSPSSSSVSHPTASAAASGYAHSQISADSASYRVKTSRESHATSGAAGCATVRSRLLFAGAGRGGEGGNELRPQDAANYTCLFSNVAGSVESVAQLVVEHAPVSRQLFDRVGANLADSAVITCRVQSHPAPQFRWLYGATELSGTADSRLTIDSDRGPDDEETEGGSDIYESRLTVKGVGSGDYGWYVCVASNQFGESSIRLLLQPKSAPSPPRQLRAAAVAGSWLQLVWTAGFDGGHRNTEYRVSLLDERQQERQHHCTAPSPCNISALLPQTTYRLRMVAENSGGSSGPSDQIQVTTLTDISAISPLNCKLMVDRKSAQMALTAPANTEGVLALFDLASAEDGAWQLAALKTVVPLSGRAVVSVPERYRGTLNSTSVRVRLCSVGDLTQCTRPILAETVSSAELEVFSASVSADAGGPAGANVDVMIASAAGAVGVLLLLAVVVGACCCWRRSGWCQRGNNSNNKGAAAKLVNQTVVAKLPPYYPPGAIDKSSASAVLPAAAVLPNSANGLISDKSAYAAGNGAFDYGHVTNTAAANNNNNNSSHTHQMAAPGFTAENNSNNSNGSGGGGGVDSQNGGSLNSQHSLWHVRESMKSTCGGGVVNIEGASGDGVALYNTNTQPLPVGYGDYGADFISYPSADDHQMTAAAAAPYHQQYGVGDSSGGHYYPQPHPHSHPHPHPQPQTHPSISYSAYPAHVADPDHCTDTMHMVGVPVASSSSSAATGPGPQHHGPSHGAAVNGAFDESLESGFSTPNQSTSRRVIREIVV